jgi:hypothetical protein
MKHVRWSVWLLVVFALVMVFAGCAKPPDAEKQAAKTAMDAAGTAGADKYATSDMKAAKKIWDTAESQMKDKKYSEAKQSYLDAKAAFEKAAVAAAAGKEVERKALTEQANAALATVEQAWKNLDQTAKKMKKKIKDKAAWTNDSKTISEGLAKAKEMIAADPVGAKAQLDELMGMIDKWDRSFKKPVAAKSKTIKKKKK